MSPRPVDSFLAWRLVDHFYAGLLEIRRTAGFNTDPFVTLDSNDFAESAAKYCLLMETDGHDPEGHFVGSSQQGGPRVKMELSLKVVGFTLVDPGETPRREAMKLEQDVRTACAATGATIRASLGHGVTFRFGACSHDAGVLTPKKQAGFVLDLGLVYNQGSTW